ncbi:2-amino-4-oxopentanoate thiolase subunit OrtA [Oceanobacillus halotolerans]|uniref:2-amino-4-oxopentanoate thiolase subunit OrtA n=1 Tax=Oceanobacillus halotolerans TaxID=2663380 RepID=UPI0013DB0930|nr:2-amino-4-oxopentanoate thiolase subunit OrtA [Oceanobacillus halotolerans]
MGEIKEGTWVEIKNILLRPEDRSNRLPDDTKKVSYEMRARGYLLEDTNVNDQADIKTLSGRIITGELVEENPGYNHGYGPPVMELLDIGEEEKKILENK